MQPASEATLLLSGTSLKIVDYGVNFPLAAFLAELRKRGVEATVTQVAPCG